MSGGYGPPLMDFSPLAGLADTFFKAKEQARKSKQEEEMRTTLASLGQGGTDYDTVGRKLLSLGELQGGLGFLKLSQESKDKAAQRSADTAALSILSGGSPGYGTSTGTPRANIERGTVHVAETEDDVQRLERATGMTVDQDLDKVVRTVYGEAGGEDIMGKRAVASVIANRARQSGMTPSDVVVAKGQFEPWSNPEARARMESLDANSPEYRRLADLVEPALRGQAADPTGGATHFYAPKAQAALGRDAPSWDDGTGKDIGNHRFFRQGYGAQGKVQVAQADAPAPGAREAQGFAIPGQEGSSLIPKLEQALASPNLSDGARKALERRLDREYKLQDNRRTDNKDRYEPMKGKSGQVMGVWDKLEGRQLTAEEMQSRGISPPQPQAEVLDFAAITGIRKEIQDLPAYKTYAAAIPAYTSMVDASKRNDKMADLNLVYGLAKIMDPTSVVREGEMIMVNNAQGLSEQVVGYINAVNGGAKLGDDVRAGIMREASSRMNGFKQSYDADITSFRNIAQRWRINEADILPNVPGMPQFDPAQINSVDRGGQGAPAPGNGASLFDPRPMAAQGAQQPRPMVGARQAPDGKFYVPDPNRPGKYLRVD